jgi:prepilin-type N-terminal cleavage/methylation domain-containing protein
MKISKSIRNEKGFVLVEVLVALALTGIIATAFLLAIATGLKAILLADERTTAESLARSQMEDIKNETYIIYSDDPHDVYSTTGTPIGEGYSISFTVVPFDPGTGQPYNEVGGIFVQDDGIQKITVTVAHLGNDVITLEGYKVDR